MNVYIVAEGQTEKLIYREWIPQLNPALSEVQYVADFQANNFYIVDGGGVPQYFEAIEAAIEDGRANPTITRVVVCADSEDMTLAEKTAELMDFIQLRNPTVEVRVVVQHYCFESWALGNRRAMPVTVRTDPLLRFKKHFDVSVHDPELLGPVPGSELNRAQTAKAYLRAMVSTKWKAESLTYLPGHPGPVAHKSYLRHVRSRHLENAHIQSLGALLTAFVA
jgi:hypothetical protein